MRILEVSNFFFPKTSGSGTYCLELSRRLARRHEVTVLTSRIPGGAPAREEIDGVAVERVKAFGEGWNISALSYIIPRLRELVPSADVVHLHSYLFLMSNQVGLFRKFLQFPLYLHLHGGLDIPEMGGVAPLFKRYLYDPLVGRFMFNVADTLLSISRRDSAILSERFGIMRDVSWVPNGIEVSSFPFLRKGKTKNVAYIGRLERWKGVMSLPGIIASVNEEDPEVTWTVVGDGPLRGELERACRSFPVHFTGTLPHERIPEVFSSVDVLLLPSLIEGVPTVALEALASGCPVVARDVGGVGEVIDERCGVLVKRDEEFPSALLALLRDPSLMGRMGETGRRKAESTYDWRVVSERFEDVIRQ